MSTSTQNPTSALACPACARLSRIGPADPFFLRELRESFLILHKHQKYPGWCTLWLKDHHEHLALLPRDRQSRLAEDVADTAAAMHRAFPGIRINYENLGNVVAHIHWHLIPRRATDPNPKATVWVRPESETDCGVSDTEIADLASRMKHALSQQGHPEHPQ